ncbi:MAG: hypothetical protein QXS24_04275 [Desulfurococcaceae archaeon]
MSTVFRGIPVSEGIVASEIVKYGLSTTLPDAVADCKASENKEQRLLNALDVFKSYVEKIMEMVNESEKELFGHIS